MTERTDSGRVPDTAGPILFARYAYPPNERGYCGPPQHQTLLEYGASGVVDGGLVELAQAFEGAWPYLQFIAATTGIADPLDRRVVEAYWIGSDLLDRIDFKLFGDSLLDRFRPRAGSNWGYLAEAIPAGVVPHHAFHVFGIYPWVGLLGSDHGDHPLQILDRCRIRWGRVVSSDGDQVIVESQPLQWDGRSLTLGAPVDRTRDSGHRRVRVRRPSRAGRLGGTALELGVRPVGRANACQPQTVQRSSVGDHQPSPRPPGTGRGAGVRSTQYLVPSSARLPRAM